MYDATIEWVAPYYRQMHQMMLRLAVESLADNTNPSGPSVLALDLGSGTGAEAIPLMQAVTNMNLIGLDLCVPMCDLFKRAAAEKEISEERYRLISGDILDSGIAQTVGDEANQAFGTKKFQVIISAFTLHHLTQEQKAATYRLIHELLDDGGIFLLGDLFNFGDESAWLTNRIFQWETSWIVNNFESAARKAEMEGANTQVLKLRQVEKQWIKHYYADNRLDSVTTQMQLMREAGFSEAGNPFRYWQVGLVWAKK